jgi:hypothetical protein
MEPLLEISELTDERDGSVGYKYTVEGGQSYLDSALETPSEFVKSEQSSQLRNHTLSSMGSKTFDFVIGLRLTHTGNEKLALKAHRCGRSVRLMDHFSVS